MMTPFSRTTSGEIATAVPLKNPCPVHKSLVLCNLWRAARRGSKKVLDGIGLHMDKVLNDAKADKAKELVQQYVRCKPAVVKLVHKLLTGGLSMDSFMA